MINFKQKEFAEFDQMRLLYTKLMRRTNYDRRKFPIIDASALVPILKGNNIVIERFVLSSSNFGKDKYRMYLKIGAKAKMPDDVRLPSYYHTETLGKMSLNMKNNVASWGNPKEEAFSETEESPELRIKLFWDGGGKKNNKKNNKKGGDGGGGGGGGGYISSNFSPSYNITREVQSLLGEVVLYDKKSRTLVLEFETVEQAIDALDILPFGINYTIYLLNC